MFSVDGYEHGHKHVDKYVCRQPHTHILSKGSKEYKWDGEQFELKCVVGLPHSKGKCACVCFFGECVCECMSYKQAIIYT